MHGEENRRAKHGHHCRGQCRRANLCPCIWQSSNSSIKSCHSHAQVWTHHSSHFKHFCPSLISSEVGGIVLGELALLYNCRRTATVRALTTCVLWSIDRHTFRQIMISTNQSQRNMHKMFLRKVLSIPHDFKLLLFLVKVSLLKNYSERKINKIVDAMQVEEFQDKDCITR